MLSSKIPSSTYRKRDVSPARPDPIDPLRKPKIVPRNMETRLCFNCNKTGHLIEDCPNPKNKEHVTANKDKFKMARATLPQPKAQVKIISSNSNYLRGFEHFPRDNIEKPLLLVSINSQQVEGLLDSGSTLTILPGSFASKLSLQL